MSTTKFKKGDRVYVVSVSHGRSCGWDHASERFRTRITAELVTLTSLGAKQGTAVTATGNLERRIYASGSGWSTSLIATPAEVQALADSIGTSHSEKQIAFEKASAIKWHNDYVVTGRGSPLGCERNARSLASIETCVPLPPVVTFI